MHTLKIITVGVALLAVMAWGLPRLGLTEGFNTRALTAYIALWFVISAVNLGIGVFHAGYTVAEELPIMAMVFVLPFLIAILTWR
ncbi:hypothetical protein SAMN03159406_05045 [Rhizobium sp. NFR03]|nr:hypothetical protein SAMN03159406_05045 [Rhizobium sp. NFR03]